MTLNKQLISLFLTTICLFCSCKPFNNELKGIDDVINYYGGECKYSIGISKKTGSSMNQYLELELSNSEIIEHYKDTPNFPASNIAYLCYKKLVGSTIKYNQIKSILVFKNGEKFSYTYSVSELEIVKRKLSLLDKTINLIKSNDYKSLKSLLDSSVFKYNKAVLISSIENIEPTLGNIKDFRFLGFQFNTVNGIELLHLSGIIDRTKKSHQFSIDVNPSFADNKIINIQYKI